MVARAQVQAEFGKNLSQELSSKIFFLSKKVQPKNFDWENSRVNLNEWLTQAFILLQLACICNLNFLQCLESKKGNLYGGVFRRLCQHGQKAMLPWSEGYATMVIDIMN